MRKQSVDLFSKKTLHAINNGIGIVEVNTPISQLEFDIRMVSKRLAYCPDDLKAGYQLKLERLQNELSQLKSKENENCN